MVGAWVGSITPTHQFHYPYMTKLVGENWAVDTTIDYPNCIGTQYDLQQGYM